MRALALVTVPPPVTGMSVASQQLLDDVEASWSVLDMSVRSESTVQRVVQLTALFLRLGWKLVSTRFDVAYITVSQSTWGCLRDIAYAWLIATRGVPFVIHLHGGGYGDFLHRLPRRLRVAHLATVGRAEVVVVLHEAYHDQGVAMAPKARVVVVPNAVTREFHEHARSHAREGGAPALRSTTPLKLLYLSNFQTGKGLDVTLDAVETLLQKGRNVRLYVAGRPHDREGARQLARLESLTSSGAGEIIYVGAADSALKARLMAECDIFVLPSTYRNEGQPIALIEAIYSGMVCIVSPYRILPNMVSNGGSGVILDKVDCASLVAAVERIILNPELMSDIGRKARASAGVYAPQAFAGGMRHALELAIAASQ